MPQNPKPGLPVICHLCGYKWSYHGKRKFYATCPQCMRQVKISRQE